MFEGFCIPFDDGELIGDELELERFVLKGELVKNWISGISLLLFNGWLKLLFSIGERHSDKYSLLIRFFGEFINTGFALKLL